MSSAAVMEASRTETLNAPQGYTLRDSVPADDDQLRKLMNVPIPSRGVQISFEREPSYFGAQNVMYEHRVSTVISNDETGEIVSTFANGYRNCWMNGKVEPLRYSADLRIVPHARGLKLVRYLFGEMQRQMQDTMTFTQTIVFDDNEAARAALRSGKSGMAPYYDGGLIKTLTLTGFKRRSPRAPLGTYRMTEATAADVSAMNAFMGKMGQQFQCLPAYDFSQLGTDNPYYQNLKLSDFILAWKGQELVGMVGLWDQKPFKQTRIVDYGQQIGFARPLYNLWARLTGAMHLPKKGDVVRYHVLHSLLCHPQDLAIHDALIREAWRVSVGRGVRALSYTLSEYDPRLVLNDDYKGELLTGLYGYFSYQGDPTAHFNPQLIPYLECGRI